GLQDPDRAVRRRGRLGGRDQLQRALYVAPDGRGGRRGKSARYHLDDEVPRSAEIPGGHRARLHGGRVPREPGLVGEALAIRPRRHPEVARRDARADREGEGGSAAEGARSHQGVGQGQCAGRGRGGAQAAARRDGAEGAGGVSRARGRRGQEAARPVPAGSEAPGHLAREGRSRMGVALAVLRRLESFLLAILMLAMSFAYSANVLVRELAPGIASSLAWIDEICLFGLVWMVFLGLGLALERGRQIAMTSVLLKLAAPLRRGVKLAIDLTGLAFSLYVAQVSFTMTLLVLRSGQVSPTLDITMSWLYGPMPAGFLLLGMRYALELAGANERHAVQVDPSLHV